MDTIIHIGGWVESTSPNKTKKPLQGRVLKVEGITATLNILSSTPSKRKVKLTTLTPISPPLSNDELPEHLLSKAEKRMRRPREDWEDWEREMHDYIHNMTNEEFQQSLKDSGYEFYSKIRTPVFTEQVIIYSIIKSRRKEIMGRLIDGMDWQPTEEGDGLRGEKGSYWQVTTKEKATHVYVKHYRPSPDCRLDFDIFPI